MKRCLVLMLTLLLCFGAAHAEAEYGGWTLQFTDIQVARNGQTVGLAPRLTAAFGANEAQTEVWLEAVLVSQDETLTSLQVEYRNGELRYSLSDAQTCGLISSGDSMLALLSMAAGSENPMALSDILDMLHQLLSSPDAVSGLLSALDVPNELTHDGLIHISIMISDVSFEGDLSWDRFDSVQKPFELSAKRDVAYSVSKGFLATEGFDEALSICEERLSAEPTVMQLLTLLQ